MKTRYPILLYRCCLTIFFVSLLSQPLSAQEIRCQVTVNSDQVEGSNKSVFDALKTSIEQYINENKWTNLSFAETEKIECNLMVIVQSVADNLFTCEMQLQMRRPIYGTSYTSPTLNFKDKNFNFTYQEFDRIEYQQNQFTTNLTAMLAYYCYLLIGIDMDTYSRLGGTPYFEQCEQIVNVCQTASMNETELTGWQSFGSKLNRYSFVNNLLDDVFQKYRSYIYEYHRLGLDIMSDNVANGRARIASGLNVLKEANRARPATHIVSTFLDAKADELVSIFQKGTDNEKKQVYELLMDIDPTRQNTYDRINQP